jgi:hypothetical protein
MKRSAILAFALTSIVGVAAGEQPSQTPMKCETGPASRQFGGSAWIVYSCDDQHSMVVISSESNPASPFYFVLKAQDGKYDIHGEGNGSQEASDAAAKELSQLSSTALADLLAATKAKAAGHH